MQAIVSDIIVNQAIQTGNLQVSQVLQNNSSPQTSFADLLNSVRSGQTEAPEKETELKSTYEDKKLAEVSKSEENQNTPKAEKTEEKENSSAVKEKTESKEKVQNSDEKNHAEKSKNLNSKIKLLEDEKSETTKVNDKSDSSDSKKLLKNKDLKNPKKTEEDNQNIDKNLKTEDLSQNSEIISAAASTNNPISEINIKDDVSENDIPDTNVQIAAVDNNQNDLLQNKLNADEKVFALDKDSKIIVHDQRTEQTEQTKPAEKNSSKQQLQVQYDNQNNATITMELAEQNASENILSLDNQTAAAEGSNFQAMLNNQIQTNAPEFVKAGSLILQDNNKGTINLVLHPDDLGNVKIHLSMDGKTVSAHITVNTKEALEVFKDNAQTLREAFAKNGYDTANFDVSYNGNSNGNGHNQPFEGRYDGVEYWARNAYGDSLGGETDGYIPDSYEFAQNSEYSINIVA